MLRLPEPKDAAAVAAIYAPYVRDTVISFETEPPSADEMLSRMRSSKAWIVAEEDDRVVGYAYASTHREREAYRWSVDVSVYLDVLRRRHGHGRRLYTVLFSILRSLGFYNAYAGIALPNAGSVGLHEAMGFVPVGIYHKAGFKNGMWHDVGWWQLVLQPHAVQPEEPRALGELDAEVLARHLSSTPI